MGIPGDNTDQSAGIALHPTLVPFTPWESLDGYLRTIDFFRDRGMSSHVPPVHTKTWFHTGEGGGGNLADQLIPGVDIEIEHDVEADTFTIDNLRTTHIDTDAPTIVCDISADVGTDHEVTINGDRDLDVVNEKLGELWRSGALGGSATVSAATPTPAAPAAAAMLAWANRFASGDIPPLINANNPWAGSINPCSS